MRGRTTESELQDMRERIHVGRSGGPGKSSVRSGGVILGVLVVVAFAGIISGCSTNPSGASPTTNASSSPIAKITLTSPNYRPKAPPGTTDDYHRTLLNPRLKKDSYVISSQFFPETAD